MGGFRHGAALTEEPRAARNALVRLKSATDFERVRRDGRSHAHPLVVLIARRRAEAEASLVGPAVTRVGFVAGKGVGTAVDRNRAKRLLREAYRARRAALAPGWDLMLIARRPLAGSTLAAAQAALDQLLWRARLLEHET